MPKQNAASLNLDHAHCRAICDEIGDRLRLIMKPAVSDIPPRLLYLIGKLAELENIALARLDFAPSIVPSVDDMSSATIYVASDAA